MLKFSCNILYQNKTTAEGLKTGGTNMKIKNLKNLTMVEYNIITECEHLDRLENLEDMTYEFVTWSNGSSYISDAFGEIADNFTPIYTCDIWEEAGKVTEYIEEAIEEWGGLIDNNLIRTFQAGICRYNELSLYGNTEELIINYCIVKLDELFDEVTNEQLKNKIANLELDDVYEIVKGIDEDSRFSDIEDAINDYLEIEEEEDGE